MSGNGQGVAHYQDRRVPDRPVGKASDEEIAKMFDALARNYYEAEVQRALSRLEGEEDGGEKPWATQRYGEPIGLNIVRGRFGSWRSLRAALHKRHSEVA